MAATETLLLRDCTVLDCALAGRRLGGAAVLVRGERIVAVGPLAEVLAGLSPAEVAGAEVEHLAGATVLPGLWDAHVHLGDVVPPHVAAYAGECEGAHMVRCVRKAQDNLRAGITSLRSLGERFDHDLVLREQIEAGVVDGPRLFASGDVAWTAAATSPEELRSGARRMARRGVDQIKVLGSGGIPTRSPAGIGTPFVGRAELAALCDEAQRWSLPVVLHAMADETVLLGAELGVRSIEHGFGMTAAVAEALSASGTALCPNLVVTESWDPAWMAAEGFPPFMVRNAAEARSGHHEAVRACISAGVRILAGADDLPQTHGPVGIERARGPAGRGLPGLVRELELLVELGLSPGEALQAATLHPAWAVGRDGDLGTVQAGKLADLLVVEGDPLAELAVLARPLRVYKAGRPMTLAPWRSPAEA